MLEKIVFLLGRILAKVFRRNSKQISSKKTVMEAAAAHEDKLQNQWLSGHPTQML